MVLAMSALRDLLLLTLLALTACGDPADDLARVHRAQDDGDDPAVEAVLREGLERHPDDLELLLVAAGFYLRAEAEDYYRPRLSLHYAMRADRVANYQDPRATRAMVMAHRGAGGFDEAQPLIRDGLAGIGHPDSEDPVRLAPVDPDLLVPTLPNLVEQRRRQTEGRPTPVCADGLLLVPEGEYLPGLAVQAFCVEEQGRTAPIACVTLGLRDCSEAEVGVVAGPVAALLRGPAAGARCCTDPEIVRILPGHHDQPGSVVGDR